MNKNKKAIFYITVGLIIIIIGIVWMTDGTTLVNQTENKQAQTNISEVNGYKNVSVDELATALKSKDFTLVNVHIPYIGDIEGTDISIPFNKIADNLDKLPKNKDAKIVLYCQSGNMSVSAAKSLVSLGYTNIINVSGGMIEWQKQGYPLIQR